MHRICCHGRPEKTGQTVCLEFLLGTQIIIGPADHYCAQRSILGAQSNVGRADQY